MPKVSICIPTYKRPDLLKVALDSCLAQTFQDFEVVIVDDSPDVLTENMIRNMRATRAIEYVRNAHRTGQANSKNQLFDLARGEIHRFAPRRQYLDAHCARRFNQAIAKEPRGGCILRQAVLALPTKGQFSETESARLNERYFRTDDRGNQVQPSEWSALVQQQFPGDSFMIRSVDAHARRDTARMSGSAAMPSLDGDCASWAHFFFVGKYAAADRRNQEGLTASGFRIHLSNLYPVLERTPVSKGAGESTHSQIGRDGTGCRSVGVC